MSISNRDLVSNVFLLSRENMDILESSDLFMVLSKLSKSPTFRRERIRVTNGSRHISVDLILEYALDCCKDDFCPVVLEHLVLCDKCFFICGVLEFFVNRHLDTDLLRRKALPVLDQWLKSGAPVQGFSHLVFRLLYESVHYQFDRGDDDIIFGNYVDGSFFVCSSCAFEFSDRVAHCFAVRGLDDDRIVSYVFSDDNRISIIDFSNFLLYVYLLNGSSVKVSRI